MAANCTECPVYKTLGENPHSPDCGEELSFRNGESWEKVRLIPLDYIMPSVPSNIVFVGDYPHLKDFKSKRIMSGSTREMLKKEFNDCGVDIRREALITSLHCHINKKPQMKYSRATKSMVPNTDVSVISNKEITQALKCCRPSVIEAIKAKAPKLIIPFGDVALRQILKSSGIGKHRGKFVWSEEFNCWVFPMFHPLMVEIDQANLPFFQADVAQIAGFIKNDFKQSEVRQAHYEDVESIRFILDKQNIVTAFDTETQGSDWCDPNSLVISYSVSDEVGGGYNIWLYQEVDTKEEATHHIWWPRRVSVEENGKKKTKVIPVKVWVKQTPNYDQKIAELHEYVQREDIKIVMMNGNYDIHRLIQLGIGREEIKGYVLDIQTGMHTLDPDNFKNASMLDIQRVLLPTSQDHKSGFNAQVDKSDMFAAAKQDPERHTIYSGADGSVTLECAYIISKKLGRDRDLQRYYKELVHPVETEVMMDIERNGMLFDMKKLPAVYEEVGKFIMDKEREIIALIPRKVKEKHHDKGLRLSRGDFLRDALFSKDGFGLPILETTPTGDPATGIKILTQLRDTLDENSVEYDMLSKHIERNPYVKLASTYLKGFEKALKCDNMFHTQIHMTYTSTGRSGSRSPNLQNIPKRNPKIGKMIRKLFVVPKGKVLVTCDLSQAELRFIAHASGDPVFNKVYNNGEDIHTNTAHALIKMQGHDPLTYTKEQLSPFRTKAKSCNFGFVYSMQAKKFQTFALQEYNVRISLAEAELFRETFFNLYAGLPAWHEHSIMEARKHGLTRSVFGGIRCVPNINSNDFQKRSEDERISINTPIQSASNSWCLFAALHAKRTGVYDNKRSSLVIFIHDELGFYVDEDYVDVFVPRLVDAMEHPPVKEFFGLTLSCPMVAEASYGDSLGTLKPWESK